MATVQLTKAAARKLRMAAGPAISMAAPDPRSSPVPIEPPTATMAICGAESWRRSPSSWNCRGAEDSVGMQQHSMSVRALLNVPMPKSDFLSGSTDGSHVLACEFPIPEKRYGDGTDR